MIGHTDSPLQMIVVNRGESNPETHLLKKLTSVCPFLSIAQASCLPFHCKRENGGKLKYIVLLVCIKMCYTVFEIQLFP